MTQMRPMKRTDWINGWWEGRKANLFTRSLKYKLQEARTFWWTSNSLPSTIIFRSVNSFSLRCWFNSFNISVEQRRNRQCQTRLEFRFFWGTDATTKADSGRNHHSGIQQIKISIESECNTLWTHQKQRCTLNIKQNY